MEPKVRKSMCLTQKLLHFLYEISHQRSFRCMAYSITRTDTVSFPKVGLLSKTNWKQYHGIKYAIFLEHKVQHCLWRSSGILLMHWSLCCASLQNCIYSIHVCRSSVNQLAFIMKRSSAWDGTIFKVKFLFLLSGFSLWGIKIRMHCSVFFF